MTHTPTLTRRPGFADGHLTDEMFDALMVLAEAEANADDRPVAVSEPPAAEVAPPAVAAPWRGGTLDVVAQLADMCGGVASDEVLDPEDRTRIFARRLARAGRLHGRAYIEGRFVAAAPV